MNSLDNNAVDNHVDRDQQIKQIIEKLLKLQAGGKEFKSIFHWFGIPGIGKTSLNFMIQNLCEKFSIPFVRIDFNTETNPRAIEYKTYTLIIEDMISGLKLSYSEVDEPTIYPQNDCYCHSGASRNPDAVNFVDHIKKLSAQKPIVILFDTVEHLEKIDNDLCKWLEDNILSHLAVTERCLLISTGRYDQRWKTFMVRRHLTSEMLDSFPKEETEKQIENILGSVYRAADIHGVTNGYPYGNTELALEVQKNEKLSQLEMINHLADGMMDQYVMKDILSELKSVIRILSVIRQFDIYMLGLILSEFVKNIKGKYARNIMDELAKTSLVQWDEKLKGYALDKTVRHILSLYMRLNNSERFLEINQKAADIYEQYIEKAADNRNVYIRESLYHHANIGYCSKKSQMEIVSELQDKLSYYLKTYYQQAEPVFIEIGLNRMKMELEKDNELEELLGENGFAELRKTIAEHLRNF